MPCRPGMDFESFSKWGGKWSEGSEQRNDTFDYKITNDHCLLSSRGKDDTSTNTITEQTGGYFNSLG